MLVFYVECNYYHLCLFIKLSISICINSLLFPCNVSINVHSLSLYNLFYIVQYVHNSTYKLIYNVKMNLIHFVVNSDHVSLICHEPPCRLPHVRQELLTGPEHLPLHFPLFIVFHDFVRVSTFDILLYLEC